MPAIPLRLSLSQLLLRRLTTSPGCLSVSAPNNFGKSAFLRHLAATASSGVEQEAKVENRNRLQILYLDCNLQADDSPRAFYELALHKLKSEFHSPALDEFYQAVITTTGPQDNLFPVSHAFIHSFELLMPQLEQQGYNRLVLILDEFDRPLLTLHSAVMRQLRALKDRYPSQLTYIVGTNLPLPVLGRQEEDDVAEFYELFEVADFIRLGGYSPAETNQLALALQPGLNVDQLASIYELSGGHPSLTRRLVHLAAESNSGREEWAACARLDPQVRFECQRIWRTLHPTEQTGLLQWLEGVKSLTADPLLGSLAARGLIVNEPAGSRIFSRTFEWFLRDRLQPPSAVPGHDTQSPFSNTVSNTTQPYSAVDPHPPGYSQTSPAPALAFDPHHEILVFEKGLRRLPLTGNAASLFKYLFMRQSIPYCSKEELITAIWGHQAYSSENLDRLVSDLRQLIGDHDKHIIRTIHRRGLQMVGVVEWRD